MQDVTPIFIRYVRGVAVAGFLIFAAGLYPTWCTKPSGEGLIDRITYRIEEEADRPIGVSESLSFRGQELMGWRRSPNKAGSLSEATLSFASKLEETPKKAAEWGNRMKLPIRVWECNKKVGKHRFTFRLITANIIVKFENERSVLLSIKPDYSPFTLILKVNVYVDGKYFGHWGVPLREVQLGAGPHAIVEEALVLSLTGPRNRSLLGCKVRVDGRLLLEMQKVSERPSIIFELTAFDKAPPIKIRQDYPVPEGTCLSLQFEKVKLEVGAGPEDRRKVKSLGSYRWKIVLPDESDTYLGLCIISRISHSSQERVIIEDAQYGEVGRTE